VSESSESGRQSRSGENESRLRKVNEGIDAGRGLSDVRERMPFLCECGRLGCSEVFEMTVGEYEHVRRSGRRFVVVAEHVDPAIEQVVSEGEAFVVVEKTGAAADAAEARDPRRDG
jgi:hypothetical protein